MIRLPAMNAAPYIPCSMLIIFYGYFVFARLFWSPGLGSLAARPDDRLGCAASDVNIESFDFDC